MVVLVDQRNHGRSPFSNLFNYQVLAEDLRNFMDDNWMYSAIIIGHSMGGKTAMEFALTYEDRVEKLIVIDIAPRRYQGGHEQIFNALLSKDISVSEDRDAVYQHLKSALINEEEGTIQFLMKNLTRKKEGGYEWKMNVEILKEHYDNILASIDSPYRFSKNSLFIRGSNSNYINENDHPMIYQLFPKSEIVTIENAGHWVHADAPTALFDEIVRFCLE
jgi:pimeloyl-ACP methyl ester carboxylesterase